MDFWNGVGDFLATLTPSDWVTASLAIVAIVIAVWTASQTWRYHPRPLLTVDEATLQHGTEKDPHSDATFGPRLRVVVSNRGSERALDVILVVTVRGGAERSFASGELAPGKSETFLAKFAEES